MSMHKRIAEQYLTQSVPLKKKKDPIIVPAPAQNEFTTLDAAASETANGENSPETNGFISRNAPINVRRLLTSGVSSNDFTTSPLFSMTKSLTLLITMALLLIFLPIL